MATSFSRRGVLAGAGAAVVVGAPVARSQTTREFRFSTVAGANHLTGQAILAADADLKAASNGRFGIKLFPSSQLGTEAQMVQQMQAGVLDMASITSTELVNHVADFGALHAPFLVKSIDQAARLLRTAEATAMLQGLSRVGLVGLGYGMSGMRHMYARDTIASVSDLKGKKMRIIPSPPFRDFYSILGAAPTPITFSEVYSALANGQIDAIDMDADGCVTNRFYDHLRTMLVTNHSLLGAVPVASKRIWDGIAPDDQSLIKRVVGKAFDRLLDTVVAQEKSYFATLRGTRLQVRDVGAGFFGNAVAEWDKMWTAKAPSLRKLRDIAAAA
ncbi:TRAP transporter substrate-binding protein [Reyranella sp. CPCC 100927]|uniref:TRAP transporter substrate-binding protein n=1 Tax=Reyranella sp. CPCC 100927 TaxID=2599616 RepID=UPI0011B3E45D|nr:TRAP transporter substrate-binding protein [Reyranella sp. CPCC 100927]TWS99607.1 TRAP transporter substrate-binding protein [Reyranella sp. CPCC 100927]